MPSARRPSRCSRVSSVGFASMVHSALGATSYCARTARTMVSMSSSEVRLGVPPPRKSVSTRWLRAAGAHSSSSRTSAGV